MPIGVYARTPYIKKTCAICGSQFSSTVSWAKYCSKKCKVIAKQRYPSSSPIYYRDYFKEHRNKINERIRRAYHSNIERFRKMHNARACAQRIPLTKNCEFCGSEMNLERHHPDYEYPKIFIITCRKCHKWVHRGCD